MRLNVIISEDSSRTFYSTRDGIYSTECIKTGLRRWLLLVQIYLPNILSINHFDIFSIKCQKCGEMPIVWRGCLTKPLTPKYGSLSGDTLSSLMIWFDLINFFCTLLYGLIDLSFHSSLSSLSLVIFLNIPVTLMRDRHRARCCPHIFACIQGPSSLNTHDTHTPTWKASSTAI